jgi:hypothetical protein
LPSAQISIAAGVVSPYHDEYIVPLGCVTSRFGGTEHKKGR